MRPLSVTIIGWIFIISGLAMFVAEMLPLFNASTSEIILQDPADLIPVLITRIIAVICGIFIIYGFNWARWLLVLWIVFHILINFNSLPALIIHCLLFGTVLFFLFLPKSSIYFTEKRTVEKI
jgi:hypothetical protein